MLDDIVAHDIAQGISVPVSTTQNRLLPPWARITSRLRAHPTGLALLISEQTFQEQACIRRNTLLREQRTYPLLDLSKRRRPQRKRLLNRRDPRPRHSNHGCPWIQKPAEKATVVLRAADQVDEPLGKRRRRLRLALTGLDDADLVASEPGRNIAAAERGTDPVRDGAEKPAADGAS